MIAAFGILVSPCLCDDPSPRLSSNECGSPQGGVLDFLTFIGITTNIVVSAVSAINSINNNINNNNNNNNNNDNNNNNNNENDNTFTVTVTNSRRKRGTDKPLGQSCMKKWLCSLAQVNRANDLEKFVHFMLTAYVAKHWDINIHDIEEKSCRTIPCIF